MNDELSIISWFFPVLLPPYIQTEAERFRPAPRQFLIMNSEL
jgi:hypothetical protein